MAGNTEVQSLLSHTKNYFVKGVLAIYIIAFTSLYVQVQPLFGDNGIVPLRDYASKILATKESFKAGYNIILLAPKIGLTHATFVELLCIVGVVLALGGVFIRRLANAVNLGCLWFAYYQICQLGQGFMSFHSDLLLLEVGFITILIAPLFPSSKLKTADHDHLTFFLVKWLVFRYFVTNVLNVYLDNDKAWYDMTAIPLVAQGIQFPSLFSWQVFNLSPDIVKLYQAYEHTVKLCAPFLIFVNLKYCRLLSFYTLLFVALPSALFFNFGWTDVLICVCLLTLLKDAYFYKDKRARQSGTETVIDAVVVATYVATVGYILTKFYGYKYVDGTIKSQVKFNPTQFKLLVDHLVPSVLVLAFLALLRAFHSTFFPTVKRTPILKTILYSVVVIGLFLSTIPTITRFAPGLESKFPAVGFTKNLSKFVAPYMMSNNYILLSKVSQHYSDGRPELQIQVRESADDPTWQQFDLRYKPGQPSRDPTRVVPHLPRIDLKMWYAARSSLPSNLWLQTFAYRLATKEKDLMNAVAPLRLAPKVSQVRVALMNYKYSSKARTPFTGYWLQSKFVSEYMPTTTIDNLKFSVKSNGISLTVPTKSTDAKSTSLDQLLSKYLEISSEYVRAVDQTTVIWTLSAIAAVSMFR